MVDEQVQGWIQEYKDAALSWGQTAVEAMMQGDMGHSRTAARQAAKYARMALQLESGEKWFEPALDQSGATGERDATAADAADV